jgi:23S rRNA (adenine2030-N6)-methyltransferase
MNYRHAYHAGNHADVLKHAVLALALDHLNQKPKPYRVLDAHAGIGVYDLRGVEAVKTGEWQSGFGLMAAAFASEIELMLEPYRRAISHVNQIFGAHHYPGSPGVILALLREQDRMIANELHPEDAEHLETMLGIDKRLRITVREAVHAVKAELPFDQRRGLVLIDPPYEEARETEFAMKALVEGHRRFANGIFMAWYPVKGERFSEEFVKRAASLGIANMLMCELRVKQSFDGGGLAGSGLVIINPPYQLKEKLELLLPVLAQRLGVGKWGQSTVSWLTKPAD